jgi:lipid A 4'-phosphatase
MVPGTEPSAEDERTRLLLVAMAGLVGVIAAVIFVGWPRLDLTVSGYFNLGPRDFALQHSDFAGAVRSTFKFVTWTTGVLVSVAIVLAITQGQRVLGLGIVQWAFLALVLVTGPGLLANSTLKDHWGRPRPMQITEFGGPASFKPALDRTGGCEKNCSFVSGEASSTFALGFALAMLARRRRAYWMAAAVAAGGLVGLIRIGEGGHFFSDVIFAAVFMALDVAILHWLLFRALAARLRDEEWWHEKALAAWRAIRPEASPPARAESGDPA